jgi:hypothetical protein
MEQGGFGITCRQCGVLTFLYGIEQNHNFLVTKKHLSFGRNWHKKPNDDDVTLK